MKFSSEIYLWNDQFIVFKRMESRRRNWPGASACMHACMLFVKIVIVLELCVCWCVPILSVLIIYFQLVFLKMQNVTIRSVFVNPVAQHLCVPW